METNRSVVKCSSFLIEKNLLERTTLSDVIYYFKGQWASGDMNRADRHLAVPAEPGKFVDVDGGWYATGDYGIHLSHHNPTSYFNPQQVPLVAWSLLLSFRTLEARHNDNFSEYERRLLDERSMGLIFWCVSNAPEDPFSKASARPERQSLRKIVRLEIQTGERKSRRALHPNGEDRRGSWSTRLRSQYARRRAVERSLQCELKITCEVNNPFGYGRQLVRMGNGTVRTAFFIPHDTEPAPWWQGENARLAWLASAARIAALLFPN